MQTQILARAVAGAQLTEDPIFPGDSDYDRLRKVWNGVIDRRPAMILRAATEQEVRTAITLAARFSLPLAVRGGGHSIPGFSSCDGGILLDLSRQNGVEVDPTTGRAEAGGGALLGQLDAAGERHDLVVPAGVISHTGVAGLTLGGGMGWLSRRFGLTIDSLEQVRIVLADGRAIDVDDRSDPDLFWALRGGGGNFGVVTRFRFGMRRLGQVVIGEWHWPLSAAREVLRQLSRLDHESPRWRTSSLTVGLEGINLTVLASGPEAEWAAISSYGAIAGGGDGGRLSRSFVEFQRRNDEADGWGLRVYARGGYFAELDETVIEGMMSSFADAPNGNSRIYLIQLGGAGSDVAEDATAYSGRGAGYYWITTPAWTDPAEDEVQFAWGRSTGRKLAALSEAGNYVNEQSDSGGEVARSAYGPAKYRRLAALKARVDPGNLFRLNQNIKPSG